MKYPDDFIDKVIQGDSLEVLKEIPDNSIDTIITDPPYGLEFMGKEWDKFKKNDNWDSRNKKDKSKSMNRENAPISQSPTYEAGLPYQQFILQWAKEVLRVAKPGAMLLAFGGTRTWHRLACGLEDAGWEIRDTLMWLYGSGFPKSLNIGKALGDSYPEWKNYGTSLKPAYEPIILAMKPLDGTFAENALKWGVAGLNIDEARIKIDKEKETDKRCITGINNISRGKHNGGVAIAPDGNNYPMYKEGRFPANLLLDETSAEMLDEQSGITETHAMSRTRNKFGGIFGNQKEVYNPNLMSNSGGASRFFYVAKASRSEREAGVDKNNHPTVKPIKLMDYLVKLTKMPNPNQVYLDPFLGSGTTAIAVVLNGRHFIGIEKEQEYVEIAKKRIEYWSKEAKNEMF